MRKRSRKLQIFVAVWNDGSNLLGSCAGKRVSSRVRSRRMNSLPKTASTLPRGHGYVHGMNGGKKTAVDLDSTKLRRSLRKAGLSDDVIDAAWPSWWSDDLAADRSGQAELRFALARKLGISPRGLLGERVNFIWNDEAKFKHLSTESEAQRAALTSFGVAIGKSLIRGAPEKVDLTGVDAHLLRDAILQNQQYVDLSSLLSFCWAVGIPVVHLRVFPLEAKSMHAMVVRIDDRYAVLLGRDASYPALIAFTLAHELGHIFCGHLSDAPALIDLKDPSTAEQQDDQERQADQFALSLLTGRSEPNIIMNLNNFNAPTLAKSVINAALNIR